jgi:hypothetical protein
MTSERKYLSRIDLQVAKAEYHHSQTSHSQEPKGPALELAQNPTCASFYLAFLEVKLPKDTRSKLAFVVSIPLNL